MAKHSKGPWTVLLDGPPMLAKELRQPGYVNLIGGEGYFGSFENPQGFDITGYVSEADARLMTAAPDLLAALREADDALEDLRVPAAAGPDRFERVIPDVLAKIRAAIDKAEGRTDIPPGYEDAVRFASVAPDEIG